MNKLDELAKHCEEATGPDRSIDGLIAHAIGCTMPDDPAGWPPRYTASIDAALTLVPDGWYWRCGKTTSFQAWAVVNRTHPDHCEPNKDEFFANRDHWKPIWTPVLALCAAALRARAVLPDAPRE